MANDDYALASVGTLETFTLYARDKYVNLQIH